jgi:deoxyribonuclease-4
MSGINYTEKGERNHLMLQESDFPYKKVLEGLKDIKAKGTVICESPDTAKDALLLKKTWEKL